MNIQPEDPFIRDKRTPKIPAKIVLALLGAFLPVSNLPGHIPYPSGLASALQSLTPEFTTRAFFNNPQGIPSQHWPTLDENSDSDDPEALADVLAITGNPESESVVNCYSLWMIRFLFEPLRGIPTTRDIVIQGFARGGEALWIMMLLSNIAWQVLGTNPSNIDNPPYCSTLYSHILQRLAAARCHFETSRELDRCYAQSNKRSRCLVCIMCKVGTLSDVINVMQHAAVFRRAFPGSPESFVNLPSLLTTIDISFQSYATHDILLSMLTHRPMFFRYDVNYPPHLSDTSFSTDDGPGLRWLYGVPDWLMVILARMNALLEGYGGCLDPTVAKELEEEIRSKWTIVAAGVDPSPSMGRIVVQESRRLTAVFFYLWYVVLFAEAAGELGAMWCGFERRTNDQGSLQVSEVYATVEASRIPDSVLVFLMLVLNLPGPVKERKLIRERMLDLMMRSRPDTFGNKVVRILDDIWARADERGRVGSAGASSSVIGASAGPEGSSGRIWGTGDCKGAGAVV
ncbi:unnamed protein product [Rhizoctonia solani]|uniref:Uncharacterized protein n=1 Tax=Rhizoctonia solani TaxID=456999 RepID=A0A8H3DS28_9AGAM|nr:unnamed protein product [Rhizoctonia solani]